MTTGMEDRTYALWGERYKESGPLRCPPGIAVFFRVPENFLRLKNRSLTFDVGFVQGG